MFHIRRILYTYLDIILRRAYKINIAVTNRCNFKCRTCNIWKIYIENPDMILREMKLEDYEFFFNLHNNWNWISFTGGEPFLRDDLFDIIYVSYNNCKRLHTISIPTNGFLKNKIIRVIEELLSETKIPSIYVSISLDGTKRTHDELRGVKGAFDKAIQTYNFLKDLNNKRLKVHFEYLISRYNQGNLKNTIESLGYKPNDFIISIAQNAFFYKNESLNIKPDYDKLLSDIKWFISNYKIKSYHDLGQWIFLNFILKSKKIKCVAGNNSFYMNPYGEIFPCIFVNEIIGYYNKKFIKRYNPEPSCYCATPCESYFSLLMNLPNSIFISLINCGGREIEQG